MSRERGFLEFQRRDHVYRPAEERVHDYKAVELRLPDSDCHEQAARCMNCGIPFCQGPTGCPLGNIIPEFNEHVYYGRWKEATDILLETNTFPEFTGRICPAPCEGACVLGINKDPVSICQIEQAIAEKGFERGYIKPRPPAHRFDQRVAIVGSGPAGLAAADVINRAGYHVIVFENEKYPGGLLRYGIPDFKLEKWVIERRIALMEKEGVRFETGVKVGADMSYRYLQNRFDAVILTGGAQIPRDLPVPGRDLNGIHFAMDFLTQQNKRVTGECESFDEEISAKNKHVVVIGGGDTGSDCVGTSNRQGAKSILQIEIMPEPPPTRSAQTPWPNWPVMRRDSSSHKEGCKRDWSVNTTEFVGKNGQVKELKCVKVEWPLPSPGERTGPRAIEGTEFTLKADLVLLAMGFVGPGASEIAEEIGVERDPRGFITKDDNWMTNIPGVFVAGDMNRGPSLVVHALANGRDTGKSVAKWLSARRNS
ncbi:MAG: glutamate synthase subunit beta [Verrucomicrobia bacterium]|nr:glutamate synthase subunit beta [Verrucomicrobiota bacterium]